MIDNLLKFWPLAQLLLTALAVWACWSMRQMARNEILSATKDLRADDQLLENRIDGHETRIIKVEGRMDEAEDDIRNLPTKADLARVEGEVLKVGHTAEATNQGIKRLEGFFLEKGVGAS